MSRRENTWVGCDGELPVCFFDLKLSRRRRDTEDVVVSGVNDHGGQHCETRLLVTGSKNHERNCQRKML